MRPSTRNIHSVQKGQIHQAGATQTKSIYFGPLQRIRQAFPYALLALALLTSNILARPVATASAAPSPLKVITFEDSSLTHPISGADNVIGTVVLDAASSMKGVYSADIPNIAAAYLQEDFIGGGDVYVSFYMKVKALPSDDVRLALLMDSGKNVGNLVLTKSGALRLRNDKEVIGADTAPLTVGALYHVSLHQKQGTGGDAILEAYLTEGDAPFGVPFASTTTGSWTSQATRLRLGSLSPYGIPLDAMFDNIQLDPVAPSESTQPSPTPTATDIVVSPSATPVKPTATPSAPTPTPPAPTATSAAPTATKVSPTATPVSSSTSGKGIWISREEIMKLPTSGSEWQALYNTAGGSLGTANIADQNSSHDVNTLAASLVCVRTGQFCDKARTAVVSAIGTEEGGRWLAVGRNLTSYVISADLLNLRADSNANSDGSRVEAWIRSFLTKKLSSNNDASTLTGFSAFGSGSNASAQEGAAYAAVAAYLGNRSALEYAWNRFRLYSCDRSSPEKVINITTGVQGGWAYDKNNPCAVNPAGTSRDGHRIDGAIINDMVRGGSYTWTPGYTQYPWVGLEGYVPAAYILYRAGFPAFELENKAVLRTLEYLKYLDDNTSTDWFDGVRANEIVHLVNFVYGTNFPMKGPTGGGRTVGFTGWTHPRPGVTQP